MLVPHFSTCVSSPFLASHHTSVDKPFAKFDRFYSAPLNKVDDFDFTIQNRSLVHFNSVLTNYLHKEAKQSLRF